MPRRGSLGVAVTPQSLARSLHHLMNADSPPVDLVPLMRFFGVRIEQTDRHGARSALREGPQGVVIFVRGDLPHTRKRWEIARQIGALVLAREGLQPSGRDPDNYAAELLLPANVVERHYRKRRAWLKAALSVGMTATKGDMVRGLAWQFEVDYRAMAIRLDELHLGPGAAKNRRIWSVSPGSVPPPEESPP